SFGAEAGDAKELEQSTRYLAPYALEGLEGAGGEDLVELGGDGLADAGQRHGLAAHPDGLEGLGQAVHGFDEVAVGADGVRGLSRKVRQIGHCLEEPGDFRVVHGVLLAEQNAGAPRNALAPRLLWCPPTRDYGKMSRSR